MFNLLRRNLLVSTAALFSLTIAPALVSTISAPFGASILSAALADDDNGGNDNGGNDDNGGGDNDGGENDDGGNDDNDNGTDDNDNGTDDDDNGTDDNGDDDNGADDDSTDDDDGVDDNGDDDDVDTAGLNADQNRDDRTSLVVNDAQLRGLANGSMVAVDQKGRLLDLDIETQRNRTAVTINAPRNSVTAVTIVPAR